MTIYMQVSKDKYELPIAVADSVTELAEIASTTAGAISTAICKGRKGFCKVVIDEEEDTE